MKTNNIYTVDESIMFNRTFTYYICVRGNQDLMLNEFIIVGRFIQYFTNKGVSITELNGLRELPPELHEKQELPQVKSGELDKRILHSLYMYLLEHNEEHLDCLERMK